MKPATETLIELEQLWPKEKIKSIFEESDRLYKEAKNDLEIAKLKINPLILETNLQDYRMPPRLIKDCIEYIDSAYSKKQLNMK